jgi:uncharacterized protein YggT (Ycf19 family)
VEVRCCPPRVALVDVSPWMAVGVFVFVSGVVAFAFRK